ncbi:MAG: type II toxin-antitoxin system PemK/MazF family toxin [Pseudobutyrivibrio sp.]|nr:type II toxin-antitoxin system PemK/MazF family toxin [Pseudobutyrivibrio sp.]
MLVVQRGDIYLADLGEGVGSEQRGERPVLIVQNNKGNIFSPTVTVLPITTKIHKSEGMPTHVIIDDLNVLPEKSAIMAEQITTIDKTKLIRKLGILDKRFMSKVVNPKLLIQLGFYVEDKEGWKKHY